MGKTRLAIRAAAALEGFEAVVVELAHVTTRDGICAAVLHALGESVPGPGLNVALPRRLSARGAFLLVLDNLEQVTVAAAAEVTAWLAGAAELRVLATSRERLGVRGEVIHELGPLTLPIEGAADADSVRLFVQRAQAVRPAFNPEGSAAEIAAIVRKLDGIPLAIELAAARARVLSPRQLLARLESRFRVLKAPDRFAEPRQATLWGAMDWSWQLMDETERSAFAGLSVCPAGFSLDAAEHILDCDPLEVVQALRDKSVLIATGDDELRFGFYESVRAFGEAKLEERGERGPRERFAAWLEASAQRWAAAVDRRDGTAARAALASERDNGLAVIHSALRGGNAERAGRVLLAFDAVLGASGPYDLHAELLDRVLGAEGLPSDLSSRLHEARGGVFRRSGALDDAIEAFERGLSLAQTGTAIEASLVANLGIALHERGRLEEAGVHHERARALFAALGDARGEARALGSLAIFQQEQGELGEAEASYRQAIAIFRREGDRRSEGVFLVNLGDLYKEQHLLPTARSHYEQGLAIVRELGDLRVEAVVLGNLGGVAHEEGRLEDARILRGEAVELLARVGDRRLEGVFRGYQATGHHTALDRELAAELYRGAVSLLEGAGDRRFLAIFLGCLGAAEAGLGRRDAARQAFERAFQVLEGLGDPLLRVAVDLHQGHLELAQGKTESVRDRIRRALGEKTRDGDLASTPAGRSDEVRFALGLLELALDDADGEHREGGEPMQDTSDALVVSLDGRSFRVPGGEPVSLGRRKAPRLILLELVRRRREGEGGLGVYDLMDVGWPGEILHPESGSNRVYVAITTLRNLGLRDILVHRDDGYLLDPQIPVVHG